MPPPIVEKVGGGIVQKLNDNLFLSILVGLALGAATFAIGVLTTVVIIGVLIVIGIGVSQFLLLGPVLYMARRAQKMELFKGLLIAAGIVFLLNAACFGLLATGGLGTF